MEIKDEFLVECLDKTARVEGEEGEFNPAEHQAYMAARRIEALKAERGFFLRMLIETIHGEMTLDALQEVLILENPAEYSAILREIRDEPTGGDGTG